MEIYEYKNLTRHDNDVYTVTAVIGYSGRSRYFDIAIFSFDSWIKFTLYSGEYGIPDYKPRSSDTHKNIYKLIHTWLDFTEDDLQMDVLLNRHDRIFTSY